MPPAPRLLAEFNGTAAPTGAFSEPTEITMDNSTNPLDPSREDVYVVDEGSWCDRQVRFQWYLYWPVDRV